MNQRVVNFDPGNKTGAHDADTALAELPADATLQEKIIALLRTIYDPEIPVNIYDLGLVYGIETADPDAVTIHMTLTSPHCPVAESLPSQVETTIKSIEGVDEVRVELVWDPPWTEQRMSEEARLLLNMY